MKIRGARLVVKALEAEGVRFTFGIPGTHNIELYDALDSSASIEPVLVTDEQAATGRRCLKIVDASGLTHVFNPHLYYTPRFREGRATLRFDLRLEKGAVFAHEWRDDVDRRLVLGLGLEESGLERIGHAR